MRILSIDVGIKHLAFCLFHIPSPNQYTIEEWDIIDLCNGNKKPCEENKKKLCRRTPRFTKNNKYYCRIHAKHQSDWKIPSNDLAFHNLKKLKFYDLKKKYLSVVDISSQQTVTTKKQCLELIYQYIDNNYLNMLVSPKAKDFKMVDLGRNIKKQFERLFKNISLDRVIVENQIGPLANRMKTIQGMVMQHFIERDIPIIEEIAASNKLKDFLQPHQKTTYNEKKKIGIQITRDKINNNPSIASWKEHFFTHKKKDDLADSFLQGLWYLKSVKL